MVCSHASNTTINNHAVAIKRHQITQETLKPRPSHSLLFLAVSRPESTRSRPLMSSSYDAAATEQPEADHESAAADAAAATAAAHDEAAAPDGDDAEQSLPDGWVREWDDNHQAYYYYNTALGLTQWTAPAAHTAMGGGPHGGDQPADQTAAAAAAPAPAAPDSDTRQYFYRDPYGQKLGPFSVAHLRAWRAHLPMDLPLHAAAASDGDDDPPHAAAATAAAAAAAVRGASTAATASADQQPDQQPPEPPEAQQPQQHQAPQQPAQPATTTSSKGSVLHLADVLGDGPLLQAWREQAAAAQWPNAPPPLVAMGGNPTADVPTAPPAPIWEEWQSGGAGASQQPSAHPDLQHQHHHNWQQQQHHHHHHHQPAAAGTGLFTSSGDGHQRPHGPTTTASSSRFAQYAEAVLAGLPSTDDAVVLAKTARCFGRPLEEVMAAAAAAGGGGGGGGSSGAGNEVEYARDPYSGRLTAVYDGGPSAATRLYGDLSRWVDPAQLESSLAARRGARRGGGAGEGGGAAAVPEGGWAKHKAARVAAKKRAKWMDD